MIHITDGQTDKVLGIINHKDATFNEQVKNIETYQDTFEVTAFADRKYAEHLTDKNRLIIPNEDEGFSEYVIDTARKRRGGSSRVRVKSFASYQLLTVAKVIRPAPLSAYTPSQALGFITNDTEWQPGVVESNAIRTFHIDNYTDPLSFLKTVANEFDLEIRFRIETDGNRVTGRFIDLLEQVGEWRGREITFGKDLDSIERTEEFGNIYTKLICLGPEDEDGNRLIIEVEDDDALRRWGRPHPITGELMHLEDTYEPTSDRSDMTEDELRRYGRTELNKRINSVVTYEANVIDLENVPGLANKRIRFGDTVRIKDEKFNPPLYVEARIFEQRRDIFTKSNKKVKLGDFIEYTEEELRAVIDRLSKQIQAKISQSELIEYTYSKVEIDDKDEYIFDEGRTFAEAVGVEAKEYAEQQDEQLKIDVEDYADQVAEDKSAEALQQALAESVSQEIYDNKMAEIATNLADKADIEYIDGQLVDKVNIGDVYTVEDVDNMINNTVSITQYTTDIDGIVTDLSNQETRIGQNEEAIGLQADRLELAEGTIEDHSAELLTMADEISAKVSATYVDTAVGDVDARVTDLSGVVSTQAGLIEGKAESTVVDAQGVRITTAEQTIDAIEGKISLIVTADDKINAEAIASELSVTPSAIDLISDNITLSANQINFDGHVFGGDATFTGRIEGAVIESSLFISEYTPNDPSMPYGTMVLDSDSLSLTESETVETVEYNQVYTNTKYTSTGLIYRWERTGIGHIIAEISPHKFMYDSRQQGGVIADEGYIVELTHSIEGFDFRSSNTSFSGDLTLRNAGLYGGRDGALHFGEGDSQHTIGNYQDSLTFYPNRSDSETPFLVRSHVNSGSYRNDFWIGDEGAIYSPPTQGLTTSNSANIRLGQQDRLVRSTSAKKYKKFIESANVDPHKILSLKPKSWIDKKEYEENDNSTEGLRRYYGIIADEMEEIGLPEYVEYADGEVENITERAWTLLIPLVDELFERIEELENERN